MLNEVADGVWVRQSEWVWSNAVVVRGDDGLLVVDPGIDGADLARLPAAGPRARRARRRRGGPRGARPRAPSALGPPALPPATGRGAPLRHGRLRPGGQR